MAENQKTLTPEQRAKRKKKLAITMAVMCAVAVVGMFFLESDLTFDFSSRDTEIVQHVYDGSGVHRISLWDPDWETNIFNRRDYLDKNRYLTYAEGGMAITLVDGSYSDYGEGIELFAAYFDALMHGDAEAVCAFFADEYFESHKRWEKITMQKLYDMRVEYLKNADVTENGVTKTKWYYKVTYKIMENDGTFRDDLISDATKAQYYVLTDDGWEMKITDISYSYQG